MGQVSFSDAAFTGFRFVREEPRAVAVWAAFSLAFSVLIGLVMVSMVGPAMAQLMALSSGPSRDPVAALALMRQLGPFYAVAGLASLLFYATLYTAMNRAVLRPAEGRNAYLRFGMDEVRQILLFLLAAVVGFAFYVALILLIVLVAVVAGLTLGKGFAAGAVAVLAALAGFCGLIFVWVRLSLASPLTFNRERVNLFGSWRLTRGRFWALFGCYLLVLVLAVVLGLLILVICAAVAMVFGGVGGLGQLFRPDTSSIAAYFSPLRLILLVIGAASSALIRPVLLMPTAEIYRQLTAAGDPERL